jgi:hypothetical protein
MKTWRFACVVGKHFDIFGRGSVAWLGGIMQKKYLVQCFEHIFIVKNMTTMVIFPR